MSRTTDTTTGLNSVQVFFEFHRQFVKLYGRIEDIVDCYVAAFITLTVADPWLSLQDQDV